MSSKISVIVPVYNTGENLNMCIDSIISQTYKNIEIILINDGSTDNSPEICDKYALLDNRVSVIHKPNSGVSSTRNVGIENSTGDYIMFVDSDDFIPVDAVEALMRPVVEYNVDYSAGNVEHVAGEKRITRYDQKEIEDVIAFSDEEIARCIYYNQGYAFAKIYSKKIIDEHGIRFNTEFSLGEDSLFVKEYLGYVKGVAITNKYVYRYIHEDTHSLSGKYVENIKDIYVALYDANLRLQNRFGRLTNYAPKCITVATAEINNIYKKGSPINKKKQRLEFIKSRISGEDFKGSLKDWNASSRPSMVSKLLYTIGNAYLIDAIYSRKSK